MSNCKREKRGARSLTRARARALPAPLHPPAAGRARARRSLARLAGLDDFSGLAKPVLFARLKEHNLDRLTRVRNPNILQRLESRTRLPHHSRHGKPARSSLMHKTV